MLTLQRGLVPACLTLSVLFSALPSPADAPAAPSATVSGAQMITLQHVVPGDLVKSLHWDLPSRLPVGVSRIVSAPAQNALFVTATPAGLAKVREIVRIVDVEPRQTQIKFAVASVSETDLKASKLKLDSAPLIASDLKQGFVRYASGYQAARLQQMLALRGAVTEEPDVATFNNVEAMLTLSTAGLPVSSQQIRVTPRINSDDSITLDLHAAFSDGASKQAVNTLRTVKHGETLLLVMPPAFAGQQNLLLFVTPSLK